MKINSTQLISEVGEPENDGLEDDFSFPGVYSRFHVNLPGCTEFRYFFPALCKG